MRHSCVFLVITTISSVVAGNDGLTTFVISPSNDIASCQPVSRCFTLSQFASNAQAYLQDNTTLILMPGNHSLDVIFTVSRVDGISIKPMIRDTVNVVCTQEGKILVDNVENIEIKDIVFTHCVDNRFYQVNQFKLSRVNFRGPSLKAVGTAVTLNNTRANVTNCLFSLYLYGSSSLSQGSTRWVGGAMVAVNSVVVIQQSMFKENRAQFGGAIHAVQSKMTITDSTFDFNTANSSHSSTPGSGGALHAESSSILIDNTTLTSNNVYYGKSLGGAIAVTGTNIIVRNSLLSDNRALDSGGALHATLSNVSIFACSVTRNKASLYTGGAFAVNSSVLTIINSLVEGNRASSSGGALYAVKSSVLIKTSSVSQNSAQRLGGVIFTNESTIYVEMSLVSGNTATSDGGVIFCISHCRIQANQSVFKGNYVEQDGGVVKANRDSLLVFRQCTFYNNSATNGGVVSTGQSMIMIVISSSVFHYNMAYGKGGVLAATKTTLYVSNSNMTNNQASIGGTFKLDTSNATVLSSMFGNNSASQGAVMYTETCNATFTNTTVTANTGQGIFTIVKSKFAFKNHTSMTLNMGSLVAINSNINFTGRSSFKNNWASQLIKVEGYHKYFQVGGAITLIHSVLDLGGVHMFMNNSAMSGGAISTYNSTVHTTGSMMAFGNSAIVGGGLYLNESKLMCDGKMYFYDNSAVSQGGGVKAVNSSIILNTKCSLKFEKNVAAAGNDIVMDSL